MRNLILDKEVEQILSSSFVTANRLIQKKKKEKPPLARVKTFDCVSIYDGAVDEAKKHFNRLCGKHIPCTLFTRETENTPWIIKACYRGASLSVEEY